MKRLFERLKKTSVPIIMLLNKIDLAEQDFVAQEIEKWSAELPNAQLLPISALNNFNLDVIKEKLVEMLPFLLLIMKRMQLQISLNAFLLKRLSVRKY